jgi:hypothetical protein
MPDTRRKTPDARRQMPDARHQIPVLLHPPVVGDDAHCIDR